MKGGAAVINNATLISVAKRFDARAERDRNGGSKRPGRGETDIDVLPDREKAGPDDARETPPVQVDSTLLDQLLPLAQLYEQNLLARHQPNQKEAPEITPAPL
jgi:hypothetical protein